MSVRCCDALATLGRPLATWRSGYAAACKAVYTGSIPVVALIWLCRAKIGGGTNGTIQGTSSPLSQTRNLSVVLTAAGELQTIQLDDALEILILMAAENDPRFDRAAARWVGRLLAETPIGLADARFVLALVERLPQGAETIRRFARRR